MADIIKITINGVTYSLGGGGGSGEAFTGATATTDGKQGEVTQPKAGDQDKVLYGDGKWKYAQGQPGRGIASITQNADYTLTITYTDGTTFKTTSIRGEKGDKGDQGIQGEKGETGARGPKGDQGETGAKGAKGDTGDTGNGINTIEKTDTDKNVDTYTITYDDGTTTTFKVTNGVYSEAVIQSVMEVGKWDGNTYSFEENYPLEEFNLEIEPDGDRINETQYDAWSVAKMVGSATSNACIAVGEVPRINIPIIIKAVVIDAVSEE